LREDGAPETLETKLRREQLACTRVIEQMSRPKTIDELFEERELEMSEN
jgi:hypothetical protein